MKSRRRSANSQLAVALGFYANADAKFASQAIRNTGSQFKFKMSQQASVPQPWREGFAFEYLDAMRQQIDLGGKYQVEVLDVTGKNSPDIRIKSRTSGKVLKEQQLKRGSSLADKSVESAAYGKQEIRTPREQTQKPKNPGVKESNVSASEVNRGANNPSQAVRDYQFKAAMAEISSAAATGAITGAVASGLLSGLEHFLAVERGELELDEAIAAVFLDTLEGAVVGAISGGAFAALAAFIPALIPVLNIVAIPLAVIGAFQLVNQIGQIIDRHEFIKRNALLEQTHRQEVQFFQSRSNRVMNYLLS